MEPGGRLDLFIYNYYFIYFWILLGISLIFGIIAFIKKSWIHLLISAIFFFPHMVIAYIGPSPFYVVLLFVIVSLILILQAYRYYKRKSRRK